MTPLSLTDTLEMKEDVLASHLVTYLLSFGYNTVNYLGEYIFAVPPYNYYPVMLVAHLDKVNDKDPCVTTEQNGLIRATSGQLGGDDRCGVYVIQQVLESLVYEDRLPFILFTHGEESGGRGVKEFIKAKLLSEHLDKINFFLEWDRRGICEYVCYNKPKDDSCFDALNELGYVQEHGSYSDVATLSSEYKIGHANISCGYFDQHTQWEYVFVPAVDFTVTCAINLVQSSATNWPNKVATKEYKVILPTTGAKTKKLGLFAGDYLGGQKCEICDKEYAWTEVDYVKMPGGNVYVWACDSCIDDCTATPSIMEMRSCEVCDCLIDVEKLIKLNPAVVDEYMITDMCADCFNMGVVNEWWTADDWSVK